MFFHRGYFDAKMMPKRVRKGGILEIVYFDEEVCLKQRICYAKENQFDDNCLFVVDVSVNSKGL